MLKPRESADSGQGLPPYVDVRGLERGLFGPFEERFFKGREGVPALFYFKTVQERRGNAFFAKKKVLMIGATSLCLAHPDAVLTRVAKLPDIEKVMLNKTDGGWVGIKLATPPDILVKPPDVAELVTIITSLYEHTTKRLLHAEVESNIKSSLHLPKAEAHQPLSDTDTETDASHQSSSPPPTPRSPPTPTTPTPARIGYLMYLISKDTPGTWDWLCAVEAFNDSDSDVEYSVLSSEACSEPTEEEVQESEESEVCVSPEPSEADSTIALTLSTVSSEPCGEDQQLAELASRVLEGNTYLQIFEAGTGQYHVSGGGVGVDDMWEDATEASEDSGEGWVHEQGFSSSADAESTSGDEFMPEKEEEEEEEGEEDGTCSIGVAQEAGSGTLDAGYLAPRTPQRAPPSPATVMVSPSQRVVDLYRMNMGLPARTESPDSGHRDASSSPGVCVSVLDVSVHEQRDACVQTAATADKCVGATPPVAPQRRLPTPTVSEPEAPHLLRYEPFPTHSFLPSTCFIASTVPTLPPPPVVLQGIDLPTTPLTGTWRQPS